MIIRDKIRRFLGIEDLLAESAEWNKQFSKHSAELSGIKRLVEHTNAQFSALRQQIEDGKIQPASVAFIDAIFKENRDRMDLVLVAVDQLKYAGMRR